EPPTRRRPDLPVPAALEPLILSAMAKDRDQRPPNASTMRRQLEALLDGRASSRVAAEVARAVTLPSTPHTISASKLRRYVGAAGGFALLWGLGAFAAQLIRRSGAPPPRAGVPDELPLAAEEPPVRPPEHPAPPATSDVPIVPSEEFGPGEPPPESSRKPSDRVRPTRRGVVPTRSSTAPTVVEPSPAAKVPSPQPNAPSKAETAYRQGHDLFEQGRLRDAIAQYQLALAAGPRYSDAHRG